MYYMYSKMVTLKKYNPSQKKNKSLYTTYMLLPY